MRLSACRVSPDGKAILIGSRDGTARIWDARTGEPLGAAFESRQAVLSVAFAPDGRSVLIGTGSDGRIGSASLWDIATRAKLAGPFNHADGVTAVAVNPDGVTALSGSWDGTAQVWERETNRPAGPLLRHRFGIEHAFFSPDERHGPHHLQEGHVGLLVGGGDGSAHWHVALALGRDRLCRDQPGRPDGCIGGRRHDGAGLGDRQGPVPPPRPG